MVVNKKTKGKKAKGDKENDENPKDWCPCGVHEDKEETIIECEECEQWWHQKCVALEGLEAESVEALVRWRCPSCIMQRLGMGSTIIQETVKSEIEKAVPGIVRSVVEATVKSKDFKKTFADIASGRAEHMEKKVEKTVEKTMHSAIKENQEALLQKAAQKQDVEHYEREKRKRNIVVSNLRESSLITPKGRYESDVKKLLKLMMVHHLDIKEEDIVTCYRAGAKREDQGPRLLIVTLETPRLAEHFHKYGTGQRLDNGTGEKSKYVWINPDMIKADRDANYNARKLMRERRAHMEEKRTKKTAKEPMPTEDAGDSNAAVSTDNNINQSF
jgi:hypothetical protein